MEGLKKKTEKEYGYIIVDNEWVHFDFRTLKTLLWANRSNMMDRHLLEGKVGHLLISNYKRWS